ncbi:MAG: prepilin peptidase [Phycisphaerae bacterium]|nr:prepilin peptidase [Phycisphaerae bacterium]
MHWGYWETTCLILVPGVLLASWIDYKARKVPNWLNAALAASGLAAQFFYNGTEGLAAGGLGLLVGFGVLIVPWAMHGMGAGDVKLMAAIGVWFGPWMTLVAFCVGGVIGGIVAVIMILSSGRLWNAMANIQIILIKVSNTKTAFSEFGGARTFGNSSQLLPYGVPLTAGSLIILCGQCMGWWTL